MTEPEKVEGDPSDRGRTIVTIADLHRSWVREALRERARPLERRLQRLTPGERTAFVRAISILAEELGSSRDHHHDVREKSAWPRP